MNTIKATEKKLNVYEMVTKRILQRLTQGDIPWRSTWTSRKGNKHPYTNHFTGKPYSFLNTLLLETPGQYATFKQIKEAGGSVKKGARSKFVIYWGEYTPKERKEEEKRLEEEGKDTSHLKVKFPKYYTVFSMDDVTGITDGKGEQTRPMQSAESPTDIADMSVNGYTRRYGVAVDADAAEPRYDAVSDLVAVPCKEAFTFEEDWYASLFTQLVHSTAAKGRCDRETEFRKMVEGDVSVKEELISEIGSSMVLSVAGIAHKETVEQQAAVCQKWIEAMQDDYRLIVSASYGAEKAARLILGEFAS